MPIEIRCPSGHRLAVEDRHAGKRLRCPKCQEIVPIPALDESSADRGEIDPHRAGPPPLPARETSSDDAPAPPPLAAATASRAAKPSPSPKGRAALSSSVRSLVAELFTTNTPGYRADSYRAQIVYFIAVGLTLLTLFQLAPAIQRGQLYDAPAWARLVILLAVIEVAYIVWMALVPDWSTVWVAMLVFATVAAFYGAALAMAIVTPRDETMLLDMDDIRDAARLWCVAVILLTSLMTYVCGRVSYLWHKAYQRGG